MAVLGKKLRSLEGNRVAFMCPGCQEMHDVTILQIGPRGYEKIGPAWGYNGNPDAPTFTPSILVTGVQGKYVNGEWTGEFVCDAAGNPLPLCCHSFVTDGRIQFLSDCTHALAGQTVDLPDVETELPG